MRGLHTPQQTTQMAVSISPAVVRTEVTFGRPFRPWPVVSMPSTSAPARAWSAPDRWASSRISVPARSESTTPTVGKCAPPRITDSSRYGTSFATSAGETIWAGMPQAFAAVQRRRSSSIRACVRATSIPPLWVNTPSSWYCSVLSRVSSIIILEYSTGKMKLEACPVEPPGFGIGPLSTRTRSRQPSSARWCTRLLPTMPAPMMTALARPGISVMVNLPLVVYRFRSWCRLDQRGEGRFQPAHPGLDPGQRQAEHRRHPVRLRRQRRGRLLSQPDQPPVVPEIVTPQLRVPVQAELGQHRAVEAGQQEVGEHVGARLRLEHRRQPRRPGEHVVAVQAGQPSDAVPDAQLVQGAVGTAVGVGQGRRPA